MHAKREEAFEWEGDDPAAAAPVTLPDGWEAVGKGSEKVVHEKPTSASRKVAASPAEPASPAELAAPMSSVTLLAIGVLAGVYLLYMVGWVIVAFRLHELNLLQAPEFWFAAVSSVIAPVLWFAAAWVLTRRSKDWVRIVALLGGVVLLVPWPFVTFGALGGL